MHPDHGETPDEVPQAVSRADPYLAIRLESSAISVRAALARTRTGLAGLALGCEAAGSVELVLAEVMNNICEHAYRHAPDGIIELSVWTEGEMLAFETRDYGVPMPDGRMPAGRPIPVNCAIEDMPEGGFGWNVIRQLTADLAYARVGEFNRLTFRMRRDARPIEA